MSARAQYVRQSRQGVSYVDAASAYVDAASASNEDEGGWVDGRSDSRRRRASGSKKKGSKAVSHKKYAGTGKKRRVKSSKTKRKSEISSHAGPLDLLALKQVNKQLHATLTAATSAPIWAAARRRAGIRDFDGKVPLTERQYLEMSLGTTCHGCHGESVRSVVNDSYLRKILCKRCRRSMLVNLRRIKTEEPDLAKNLHPLVASCAIRTAYTRTTTYRVKLISVHGHAWIDDVWRIDARLRALDEESDDGDGNSDGVLDVVRDSAEDLGTTTTV
ncbi:hypothetical protein JCM8202_002217 [Rhodotorula sphaerocarpa]